MATKSEASRLLQVNDLRCRSKNRLNRSYSRDMVWEEAVGLFGLACFWALTLFMVFREPAAQTAILWAEESEP
jgi:hypothetical protein